MSETNNNGNKNKGFLNGFKNLVNKGKEKVANFKEKHPVAYKVVGGVIVVGTAAAAGTVAYNLAKSADEKKNQEINVPLIDSGNNEPVKVDNNMVNLEKADQEDWEANKDNWTKVINVANELDLKPMSEGYAYHDDYHIYNDGDGIKVAHIVDGDYHYPPKDYSVTDESESVPTEASEG